jgi:hypothetical protein
MPPSSSSSHPYESIPLTSTSTSTSTSNSSSKNERYEQSTLATNASWAVNWFLFFIKLYAFVISSSKAIAAALVDSAGKLVLHRVHVPYIPLPLHP